MDNQLLAAKILELFPTNFRTLIESLSVVPLSSTYRFAPAGKSRVSNVVVRIQASVYYPNGFSFVLAKSFDDKLHFINLEQTVCIDAPAVEQCILAECQKIFSGSSSFACCSHYSECSEIGSCVHQNPFYSFSCIYRKNLESGRNFYRK